MKILLFSDAFAPYQSSASIQLKDLTNQFSSEGHDVTVFTSSGYHEHNNLLDVNDDIRIFRIKNPRTKNINFLRRALAELLIPITTLIAFYRSPCLHEDFDVIIWYSPTIFFGIPVHILKKKLRCKSYLILRDIFPEWALNIGHMKKRAPYYLFKLYEKIQYKAADFIGVQSVSNINYFRENYPKEFDKVEVLNNWLDQMEYKKSNIDISKTSLQGKYIAIYAGNIGSAQKLENIIDLVSSLKDNNEIGFIFIGDGDARIKLIDSASKKDCKNILFFDPIPHSELRHLYEQCDMGIISLDTNHKTHNIPGKFLSYLINGLDILALVNPGNDIIKIINDNNLGIASIDPHSNKLKEILINFVKNHQHDGKSKQRNKKLALDIFSSRSASQQILSHFVKR